MTNIIIYTNEETLDHKKGLKEEGIHFYWTFRRFPKKIEDCERIYFATNGFIKGYFLIADIDISGGTIEWNSETWKDINPVPTKAFQGFKYADKVEELKYE